MTAELIAVEPHWLSTLGAIAPVVTAIIAVLVGIAGYSKFIRGRTFHPRLTLEIKATASNIGGYSAVLVVLTIKNDGHMGVLLDAGYAQILDIFIADAPVWDDAVASTDGVLLWYDGVEPHRRIDVLADPGLLSHAAPSYRGSSIREGLEALGELSGVLLYTHTLEPGEQIHRELLVPVSDAVAYLLELSIHGCKHAGRISRHTVHRRCLAGRHSPDLWQSRSIVRKDPLMEAV